jgi:CheY-like chemotaxis protein
MAATLDKFGQGVAETSLLPLRPVTIALIGVTAEDRNMLLDAFEQLPDDRILYRPVPLHMRPDVLLVNADDARALASWVRFRNYARNLGVEPPSIVLSSARTFDTSHHQLSSPLEPAALLALLRKVSEQIAATSPRVEAPFPTHLDETAIPAIVHAGAAAPPSEPISVASLPVTASETARVNDAPLPSAGIRALVVDQSLPVRIQMRQVLQPMAWHIDFAATGKEALTLLEINDYRIVFVAPQLPDTDGYEVCRRAKQRGAVNSPVVMLTSASNPADRVKGQEVGCDTYLIKPVTPQVLRQLLDQYLAVN